MGVGADKGHCVAFDRKAASFLSETSAWSQIGIAHEKQRKMEVDMKRMAAEAKLKKMVVRGMKLALLLILVGSLAIASSHTARAQMISPFGPYRGPALGEQDYKLAREALETLLNEKPQTVGNHDTWNNSASGNHGKFTILEVFTSQKMPCRKVNADISYRRSESTRSFMLNFCRLPSGEWKSVAS
jgi:surface antigen